MLGPRAAVGILLTCGIVPHFRINGVRRVA
jgi:hypothetical protein